MVETSHTAGLWPQIYAPLRGIGHKIADWFAPRADAAATQDFYEINMELPGVSSDNIDISLHDGQLSVKGEKRYAHEESGKTYFFSEREYGTFQRSFRLPADVEADSITADFKDGILMIKVPKAGPAPGSSKKVTIRAR